MKLNCFFFFLSRTFISRVFPEKGELFDGSVGWTRVYYSYYFPPLHQSVDINSFFYLFLPIILHIVTFRMIFRMVRRAEPKKMAIE